MKPPLTRGRVSFKTVGSGTAKVLFNNALIPGTSVTKVFSTASPQRTTSEGHDWPPVKKNRRHKKPASSSRWEAIKDSLTSDKGGQFMTAKSEWVQTPSFVKLDSHEHTGGAWSYRYDGPILAFDYPNIPALLPNSSYDSLVALGTIGIARASPTNPLAGMGQFLAELRDLPKAPVAEWKRKARQGLSLSRNGSDAYLNAEFGWFPFVKDVLDFCKSTRDFDKRRIQFQNGSGTIIRRKRTIVDTNDSVVTVLAPTYGFSPASINCFAGPAYTARTVTTKRVVIFSGAFTYYLDTGIVPTKRGKNTMKDLMAGQARRREQIINHLYGTRITPHLFWQIGPWSWAADWMASQGAMLRNSTNFANDGLVMRYGYVSEKKTVTTSYSVLGLVGYGAPYPLNPQSVLTQTATTRTRATPYGFGLNPSSFSLKQWAIIAALGISKAPRSLNF